MIYEPIKIVDVKAGKYTYLFKFETDLGVHAVEVVKGEFFEILAKAELALVDARIKGMSKKTMDSENE